MKKYLFLFLFAIFFTVNVSALEYGNGVYVTNNTTISVIDTSNNSYTVPQGSTTTVYNVTDMLIQVGANISYNFVKDRYYEFEVHLSNSHFNDLANNVVIYSAGNVCMLDEFVDFTGNYPKIRFHCNDNVNSVTFLVNNNNDQNALITTSPNFYFNYAFLRYAKSIQEEVSSSLDETNQKLDDINDTIFDSTQEIIDNQNQNSQNQIDSQKVCTYIDKNSIVIEKKYLSQSGSLITNNNFGITDYFKISSNDTLVKVQDISSTGTFFCFYDINKNVISCLNNHDSAFNTSLTIPNNSSYVRFSINISSNLPSFQLCRNGNQALDDTLTDSNIDDDLGESFFDDFENDDHGLSSIITIPLNTIQSLTSSSCLRLSIPIPFTNSNVYLPCMNEIYQTYIPNVYNIWKSVTFGIIAYFICLDIFKMVKGFKDPESDKVEVLDL